MISRHCELCSAAAAVYCPSDAAFLCRNCDEEVHDANFLAARHVRQRICSNCGSLEGDEFTGAGRLPDLLVACPLCSHGPEGGSVGGVVSSVYNSSYFSGCISSTASPAKDDTGGRGSGFSSTTRSADLLRGIESRRSDYTEAEGELADWCRRFGVSGADVAVPIACKGLRACAEGLTVVPYRVSMAASMWLGLRLCRNKSASTWQVLKRLEELSGVPARVILAAELKLRGASRRLHRRRMDLEEGSGEC